MYVFLHQTFQACICVNSSRMPESRLCLTLVYVWPKPISVQDDSESEQENYVHVHTYIHTYIQRLRLAEDVTLSHQQDDSDSDKENYIHTYIHTHIQRLRLAEDVTPSQEQDDSDSDKENDAEEEDKVVSFTQQPQRKRLTDDDQGASTQSSQAPTQVGFICMCLCIYVCIVSGYT